MLRRIWILNLGLIALLVFGVLKFRQDWRAFAPMHDVQAIRSAPSTLPALPAAQKSGVVANASWTDIPTHDPFSFDRSDIAIVVAEAAPPPKPLGPKPILFGTLILGPTRIALVSPNGTGNRSSRPMKIGETIDGWTLTEINDRRIQIESSGVSQSVSVDESVAQVPRDNTRTSAIDTPSTGTVQNTAQPPAPTKKGTHMELTPFGSYREVPNPQ